MSVAWTPGSASARAEECEHPCAPAARPWVLAATIVASAMAFIDGTVVNIALPGIGRALGAGMGELQWVTNAYSLVLGTLILVGGALGDRFGRRRIFQAGILGFTVASLGCALAPNVGALVAARALQGAGAALLVPQSLAILSATFPLAVRGRAIGTWAASSAITTSLGPPLGGLLIDRFSWRAAFWVNLPLAVLALALTWRFVPESRDEEASGGLDWPGATLALVALAALNYGLAALARPTASALLVSSMLALGVAGIVALVAVERRVAHPLVPPQLFRSRTFTAANVVTVLLYGSLAATLFLLPFDLLARRGLSATRAGLTMLPLGLVLGLLSRPLGGLADRHGPRAFLVAGPLVVAGAVTGLAFGQATFVGGVLLPILVLAVGMSLVVSPLTTAVMNAAPTAKAGAASGVNNAASRVAGALAVAALGALASVVFARHAPPGWRLGALPPPGAPTRALVETAFVDAYRTALVVAAGAAALASLVAFLGLPRKTAPGER